MGYHYVKGTLVDGVVDPLAPEALLYVPTKKGLKLVGVEYLSTEDQSLFGVDFDRLMMNFLVYPSCMDLDT